MRGLLIIVAICACESDAKKVVSKTTSGCGKLQIECSETLKSLKNSDRAPLYAQELGRVCDSGDLSACSYLVPFLVEGSGVTPQPEKARELAEKACRESLPSSCNNYARLLAEGIGGSKNESKASELYQKSCEGRDVVGCFNLGLHYELGKGVEQDIDAAEALYSRSCLADVAPACLRAAEIALVKDEKGKAKGFFDRACSKNIESACSASQKICNQAPQLCSGKTQ